jgi:Ca-activated chloride channel family protein
MHFNAHLDIDLVAVEQEDEVSVLLELTAPQPKTDVVRAPATLQIVLDRSGSMSGGRLDAALTALDALVARLDPTDRFGLVMFDDQVDVVVPAGPLHDKASVRELLGRIVPGGCTNLSGGYLRGLQEAQRASNGSGATLLLLSDGHANAGITDAGELESVAAAAHRRGITTTTLGLGLGYDEVLMTGVARGGTGSPRRHWKPPLRRGGRHRRPPRLGRGRRPARSGGAGREPHHPANGRGARPADLERRVINRHRGRRHGRTRRPLCRREAEGHR